MKNKNIFSYAISLVACLALNISLQAETATTETCILESSQPFGYTGDTTGKRFYTQEEYTYLCTKTKTERGECNDWNVTREKIDVRNMEPQKVYFETDDNSGSMGQMLAITQAYNKINGLWSGWHGLCMKGKDDGNWDWLSDPYVLGSYALTAVSYGSTSSATSATQSSNFAQQQGMQSAQAQKQIALAEYTKNRIVQYSVCAARAGLDVARMVEEYEDDGEACDPIDEFCSEQAGEIDGELFTIPESKYNDLITESPDFTAYIKIVKGQGTGTVTIKVINPGNNANAADMQAAKDAAKKIKEIMLKIRAAIMAIQLYSCIASNGTNGGSQSTSDASPTSAQNLGMTAISMYNPMVGMALDMAMNTYASLQDIDTCGSESDAKEKGTRHIATLQAKRLGQCHYIESITTGDSGLGLSKQTRHRYCCYDDKITRIMTEQAKAQLGKDWQHCTDISLREIQYLKFTPCDPAELDAGVNGVNLSAYATQNERFGAYQYTHKCIDTREYMNYFKETFGGDDMLLDKSDIEATLENLK